MSVCPHCHTAYGWDGHQCHHCQSMTAVNAVGSITNAAAGMLWLTEELRGLHLDVNIQDLAADVLGDHLSTLGEMFGDHLGDVISGL